MRAWLDEGNVDLLFCFFGGRQSVEVIDPPITIISMYSKTCTVEECAKLCLDQEGCNYFIVGNGMIDGDNKTGEARSDCLLCALFA